MAAPEGGSVLLIPKRYLVAGAFALFVCAGIPPTDLPPDEPPLQRQSVVAPRYAPPPPTTFVHQGQVGIAASVEDPPEGKVVRAQVIPPYRGPRWITTPQLQDAVVGLVPEADQHLDIPRFQYRPSTTVVQQGVQPTSVVASEDELASTRRRLIQPPFPKYRGNVYIAQRATEADDPIEAGTIVVALPPYYPKIQSFRPGQVPPPDVVPQNPISDRIRIILATYPYRGQTIAHSAPALLVEIPVESGTILIPNPAKSWPNYSTASWIRRQGEPPSTVVVPDDEEVWPSHRAIVIPAPRIYAPGQFLTAKAPPADVVTPQDEENWTSRRVIALKDYSLLWAQRNLSYVFVKQVEEDLSLLSGVRSIVVPPPYPYNRGQFQRGIIQRTDVVVTVDELKASRRVISLAPWRQKYFAGGSFVWVPRPDNVIVPIISACISVDEDPMTVCRVTEGPITVITWEVEC